MKALRATKTHEQHFLLSAPATLALAIDAEGLDWPTDRELRVLICRAQCTELIDHGQWFRFTAAMLETDGRLAVTASGIDRESLRQSRVPNVLFDADRIPVTISESGVQQVLDNAAAKFDLAICFSELPTGAEFLSDLKALAKYGLPFYFTAFSSLHALLNHAILRAHGATAEPVVGNNPFSLVSKRSGENWNRVISRVKPEHLPAAADAINEAYFDALAITGQMVLKSHQSGEVLQPWPVGAISDNGLLHTLDGVFVCPQSGRVVDGNTQQEVGTLGTQWFDVLRDYDPDWDETDRLIWAAHVRYFVLADGIECSVDTQSPALAEQPPDSRSAGGMP